MNVKMLLIRSLLLLIIFASLCMSGQVKNQDFFVEDMVSLT